MADEYGGGGKGCLWRINVQQWLSQRDRDGKKIPLEPSVQNDKLPLTRQMLRD